MSAFLTNTSVHYARPLMQLSVDYYPEGYVAEKVLPVVPVQFENDKYLVWDHDSALDIPVSDMVADGRQATMITTSFSYQFYAAQKHALMFQITDRMVRNADSEIALQLKFTRLTQNALLTGQELRVAALMSNTANYAASNSINLATNPANQWNNAAFAGSIEQIFDGAAEAIRLATGGHTPNVAVIPQAVAKVIKRDAMVRELVKYTHNDLLVSGDLPARLWNLDILVPTVSYNAAGNEGVAGTMTDVWGKNVYVMYRTPQPGLNVFTYGFIFRVRGVQIRYWRDEPTESTMYEVAYIQDERVVSPYAGYLMQNVIA